MTDARHPEGSTLAPADGGDAARARLRRQPLRAEAATSSPRATSRSAIEELTAGLERGDKHQVLLGVTGSGKTFTMASVHRAREPAGAGARPQQDPGRPALPGVQDLLPENAVEYFVSYYDYYQPEAYVPQSDTYIEKESTINDEIDRLRLSATRSLFERRDVVIVASVSCIYGLGSPEAYYGMLLFVRQGDALDRARAPGQAGGGALRPQRLRAEARHLPRARRRDRDRARVRGDRRAHRAVRRRDRAALLLRPADGQDDRPAGPGRRSTRPATT